jgi:hypothetical protein
MKLPAWIGRGARAGQGAAQPACTPQWKRNLLILHTQDQQALSDCEAVKTKIEARAPDIEVRIGSNDRPSADVARWQVTRPSLVFSPFRLLAYRPPGGAVYAGSLMGKIAECARLEDYDLPVPRTARLLPDLRLDPAIWGDYVIVKPVAGLRGRNIRLIRTSDVAGRFAALTDNARRRMLVQQFIEHIDAENYPISCRVLTLFGEPLCQVELTWTEPRLSLAELAAGPAGRIATNAEGAPKQGRLIKIPEILALARRVAAAFPEIPCLGQDIIRQTGTGKLYILETNPSGAIWHLSSATYAQRPDHTPEHLQAQYTQFNALDVAANQLIARTRAEAS